MDIEQLIEDYKVRLRTAESMVAYTAAAGNDQKTYDRLSTKASCYREFIAELTRLDK